MATERKGPDALIAQTNLTGTVSAIQDDPDTPDGNWLTYITNNVDTVCHVSFPTPTGNPTVGAGLQQFKIWVRKQPGTGTPTVRIDLYENGTLKANILAATSVTSSSGQLFSATWNANLLGTADGSLVECYIYGTAIGGGPTVRCTVEVGAVEWNVTYDVGAQTFYQTLPATAMGAGVLSRLATRYRALPATATGVGVLSRLATMYRAMPAMATGVAVLNKGMYKTLAATTTGVAVITLAKMFSQALAAVAVGVAALSKVATYQQILVATAVGVTALTKTATHYITLAAIVIGVPGLIKGMQVKMEAIATGFSVLDTKLTIYRTLEATSTGISTLAKSSIFSVTLVAVVQGVVTLTKVVTASTTKSVSNLFHIIKVAAMR